MLSCVVKKSILKSFVTDQLVRKSLKNYYLLVTRSGHSICLALTFRAKIDALNEMTGICSRDSVEFTVHDEP